KIYTITETKDLNDSLILTTEYSEKFQKTSVNGETVLGTGTLTRVKEANLSIISSIRENIRVRDTTSLPSNINDVQGTLAGFINITKVWEANVSSKGDDNYESIIYNYKVSKNNILINYIDTFLNTGTKSYTDDILDTRQEYYYQANTETIYGKITAKVTINKLLLSGSTYLIDGYNYEYYVNKTTLSTVKMPDTISDSVSLKISENYLPIDPANMQLQIQKDFLESMYYASYQLAGTDKGKLVLERFEGSIKRDPASGVIIPADINLTRVSVEKRSSVDNGHAATLVEQFDPTGGIRIGVTRSWREQGDTASIFKPNDTKIYTITETKDLNDSLILT
ncbi:MAG: hypothetical protein AAB157_04050, partial [Candidatus Omnitrophota bacterium]